MIVISKCFTSNDAVSADESATKSESDALPLTYDNTRGAWHTIRKGEEGRC